MSIEHPTPTCECAEPAKAAPTEEARARRQDAFKAHLAACPACARDEREMCKDGYRLLVEALK